MQRRTALISAAAVTGAVLSGATAVGANIGILASADDNSIGNLSAATAVSGPSAQAFSVDAAGTVVVDASGSAIRVTDVTTNPGWTSTTNEVSATEVLVAFESGGSRLEFVATRQPDGTLDARVDQPIAEIVAAPTSGTPAPTPSVGTPEVTPAPSSTDDSEHGVSDDDDELDHEHDGADDDD